MKPSHLQKYFLVFASFQEFHKDKRGPRQKKVKAAFICMNFVLFFNDFFVFYSNCRKVY